MISIHEDILCVPSFCWLSTETLRLSHQITSGFCERLVPGVFTSSFSKSRIVTHVSPVEHQQLNCSSGSEPELNASGLFDSSFALRDLVTSPNVYTCSLPYSLSGFGPESDAQSLKLQASAIIDLTGDGFMSSERSAAASVTPGDWTPRHDYDELSIGELVPGPRWVSFTGRIVTLYDQNIESKMSKAAKGCLKVLVSDERAIILVSSHCIPFCSTPIL